jgi:hypothetical protein
MRALLRLIVAELLVPLAAAAVFAWLFSPFGSGRTACPGPTCSCPECVVEWGVP